MESSLAAACHPPRGHAPAHGSGGQQSAAAEVTAESNSIVWSNGLVKLVTWVAFQVLYKLKEFASDLGIYAHAQLGTEVVTIREQTDSRWV